MQIIPVSQRTTLSLIIASCFMSPVVVNAAECPANTVCETVIKTDGDTSYSGGDIVVANGNGLEYQGGGKAFSSLYLKNNIQVSGQGAHAIYLDSKALFTGNLNIEGGNIVSKNDTAIKIDGNFQQGNPVNPNLGIYIKNGGLISGAEHAIDFSGSTNSMRIDVHGTIDGNIIGNNATGNKINFAYGSGKEATFDGQKITGVDRIENHGNLTIIGQNQTIVWESDFTNKNNASMDFKVGENSDLNNPVLLVTGKTTFNDNSTVKFSYTGSNVNDLLGKDVILLESEGGITGGDKVTVGAGEGFDVAGTFDSSPLLAVDESWLEQTPPEVNGGVSGDQLIARYAINYTGGDEFVGLVSEGGAKSGDIVVADYIVNYALKQHSQTGSDASGELVALLASSGADAATTAKLADELTPDAEGSEVRAALMVVDKMRSQVDDRTNVLRNESHLGQASTGWNAWSNLIFGYGNQSNGDTHGYDLNTYGINVGIDRVFDSEKLFGLSFAYVNSTSDIDNTSNSNDIDSLQGMVYAGWFNERYFVDGNVNIGTNTINSKRTIGASTGYEGNTSANAEYGANQLGYQLMAGMKFDLDMVKVEPRVAYNYQWLRVDDYSETGSPASLKYDRTAYSVKHFGAGFTAYNTYDIAYGQFTPLFSLMAYFDMNDDERIRESAALTMDTSTDRFVIYGDAVGGDLIEAKFNANLNMGNGLSAATGLTYYQRDDYNEAFMALSVTKRF
ncbi:autotransporter outer membrane beta-barrel domain-containing protein [Photobacterium nomapromontoriensis]|uniref:autotransporter family protein n=1 Tax=Photobacterium nomapromontoriensis TaxID=2910237 RepID=UPI003D0FFCAD